MKNILLLGTTVATITGLIIGFQVTINGKIGSLMHPARAGIYLNLASGVAGALVMGIWIVFFRGKIEPVKPSVLGFMLVSGILSVMVLIGIAYSMNIAGVASGLAAVIFGQLLVSVIVDAIGWGGAEPIPLSAARISGLLVIMLGVYLLLPKT
jgi:transporter family-2 protein